MRRPPAMPRRRPPAAAPVPRTRTLAAVAAVLLAAALGGCAGGTGAPSSTSSAGGEFDGAPLAATPAPAFTLTDLHGSRVSLADYRGQPVVLAFLHSGCHACTVIAQQIRGALDELPHPPPVLLVSVAPASDTPAAVASFLAQVGLAGRVRYLVGPARALASTLRAYRVRTPAEGAAAFEAAAPVLLIDADGRERVLYEEEQLTPEALAHDIRKLQGG